MDEPTPKEQPSSPNGDSTGLPTQPVSQTTPADESPSPYAPGQIVSSQPNTTSSQAPDSLPPQVITSSHGKGKRRWLKVLVVLVILVLVGAGGWLAYQKHHDKSQASTTTAKNKEIPLLKLGIVQANFGANLYPDMSLNEYSFMTNSQMFEGLVRYENKSKIVPDLATDWTNPDSKTWLFTIKPNVMFHDGHTLTPKDVKYSLDTIIGKSDSDIAQTFANTIASVEVVGSNQVKITTTDPDPTLLNRLAFLYIIDANVPKSAEPSQAGTGPYLVKPGTKASDSKVQMVAFDKYHGGVPTTKALNFTSLKDAAGAVKDFNQHKYNIVGTIPTSDAKNAVGATKFVAQEADVRFIGFNTVAPGPLQNKLVREAIRYAVDPTAIGNAFGSEITPLSQLIPESIPGYNPAIKPYKQDVNKAKQLLAQAGYPNGLTIRYSTSADPSEISETVKELKQVGITVNVDRHTDFDEFIDYFSNGKAEMYSVDYASDTLDGLDIYNTTLISANHSNPQVTQLLAQAQTTVDPTKRLKLLQDVAELVDQDISVVPLITQNDLWLMDKPYVIQQDMPSSLMSVYFYKVHMQ